MPDRDRLWYKDAVFYEVHVRAFYDANGDGRGDLRGLISRLDYLQTLGVDCLWLLPIFPSPLKDDGYDVADYTNIHPDYGTLADLRDLVDEAHRRGLRLIVDLVLNHTSDQHPWFQAARADRRSPYRDYYVWSDTDRKYSQARIVFFETETSNWTWDEAAGQYYWHRFYSSQPDLNFDNPAVRAEMLDVVRLWLELGIDGFRVDAAPHLFEREDTTCEGLPETHAYLKDIRRLIDAHYPDRILLAEANQWPEEICAYFGDGDEFHMGFHFPLMPRIFLAIGRGDRGPLVWVLDRTPPIPESCQWCIFLRNHDELTLEMVTEEERAWMQTKYAPDPRMRFNLGIRRRLAPLLDNDRRRIELAYSLLLTMPGSPILYYGDEIGMGDNVDLPDRHGVRTPMQWDEGPNAGFSTAPREMLYAPVIHDPAYRPARVSVARQLADPDSLLNTIRRLIAARKLHRAFGRGDFAWVDCGSPAVAAYTRSYGEDRLLIVNNLSPGPQPAVCVVPESAPGVLIDLLRDSRLPVETGQLKLTLEPYAYRWFAL